MDPTDELEPDEVGPSASNGRLRAALVAMLVAAALVVAGGVGYVIGHRGGGSSTPDSSSVDAGFVWDMTVHHRQAVSMAGFTRDHSTDPAVALLAYDIESSQNNQVGQMQGWLDAWGLPVTNPNPVMAWMAGSGHDHTEADGLMPGMATQAEIDKLQSLSGKALDVYFLQLMLRHHQGGLPMVQWAATHASEPYVRNAAQKMADSQSGEIILMEQMLRERNASPLAPPA
ncbi:DUF305 domain-containing protein [Jatrophihabitans sp. DSM 45814]